MGMRDWRTQLGLDERIEFEAAAGDVLEELGYGRSVSVDRATQARADRLRASFEIEAAQRRRKVLSWCEVQV